jgi:GTP-binding nuclear protein Ran
VEVVPLHFQTNHGQITFNCWDVAGQEKFGGLPDGYYMQGKAAILMFDVTSRLSYRNIPTWYKEVTRVCGDIPIILCGTKVDIADRKVNPKHITFHRKKNLQYYDISSASNYNFEKPFLRLAQLLLGEPSLTFEEVATIGPPPDLELSAEKMSYYEKLLAEACNFSLPSDDDDDLF